MKTYVTCTKWLKNKGPIPFNHTKQTHGCIHSENALKEAHTIYNETSMHKTYLKQLS